VTKDKRAAYTSYSGVENAVVSHFP
jgi:hypothetical protein